MTGVPPIRHEGNTTMCLTSPGKLGDLKWTSEPKSGEENRPKVRKKDGKVKREKCFIVYEKWEQQETNSKLHADMFYMSTGIQYIKQEMCRNCFVVFWWYSSWNSLDVKNICQFSATFYPCSFPDVFICIPHLLFPDGPSSRVMILSERFFQENLFVKKTLVKWYIADTGQKMVYCKNMCVSYIFKRKTLILA